MTETEFKAKLADFTKISAKEFESNFREWMERDDVARALQAKLRTDLVAYFNKTSLGKQMLTQTKMTTGGGYAVSGQQRLTLSPLTLALNTLVAEFLYAQNCHFSLSVFCTEVPFCNTLPDFESKCCFRFSETEILEIFEAIFGVGKCELIFKNQIVKNYSSNPSVSLLWLILKELLEKLLASQQQTMTQQEAPLPSVDEKDATRQTNNTRNKIASEEATRHDVKKDTYNTNFRYLNKYLIILSKKVSEMALQFENLQKQRQMPQPRLLKTARLRKYENLNRSLDRITDSLRHMSHSKRKSKRIGAIVGAIDALALQFGKCAANFENIVTQGTTDAITTTRNTNRAEKQTETEHLTEKSYADWVHEMRHSANGQKFLDRIEMSLSKALNKQKEQLHNETEMKLRHQKELLKIHYKQKLIEQLPKNISTDISGESRKFNENIEQQLKLFEKKHFELLHKISETEMVARQLPCKEVHVEKIVEVVCKKKSEQESHQPEAKESKVVAPSEVLLPTIKKDNPSINDAVNTRKQLQEMAKNITEQERIVDHIVYYAKLRMQELENEGNQLEESFRDYLERQRRHKEETPYKMALNQPQNNILERKRLHERYSKEVHHCIAGDKSVSDEESYMCNEKTRELIGSNKSSRRALEQTTQSTMQRNDFGNSFKFRNPILDAKEKFFVGERKLVGSGSEICIHDKTLDDNEIDFNAGAGSRGVSGQSVVAGTDLWTTETAQNVTNKHIAGFFDAEKKLPLPLPTTIITTRKTTFISKMLDRNINANENTGCTVVEEQTARSAWNNSKNKENLLQQRKIKNKQEQKFPVMSVVESSIADNVASKKTTAATTTTSIVLQQSMAKIQELFEQKPIAEECDNMNDGYDPSGTTEIFVNADADVDLKVDNANNNDFNMQPNQTYQQYDIISARADLTSLTTRTTTTTTTDSIRPTNIKLIKEKDIATTSKTNMTISTNLATAIVVPSEMTTATATDDDNADEMSLEEIGEIIEGLNPNLAVVAKIKNSSSSVSSIELQMSTGVGCDDDSAESGSEFWQ